jgi:hypothetical protein
MRKIEQQMKLAVETATNWAGSNTTVSYNADNSTSYIFLHGNHIASYRHTSDDLEVNTDTLREWATPTTKSRLRALGADVCTRKGITYLDGVAV